MEVAFQSLFLPLKSNKKEDTAVVQSVPICPM